MGRNSRAVYPFFRLRWFLAALFLSAAVGVVYAGVNVNPTSIRHTATTATGVRTAVTLEATFSGTVNGVKNYMVPVPVSSGTLGNLAKGAFKRVLPGVGWYLTAKTIINEAGWVIDELQKQVVAPATGETAPSGTRMWCAVPVGTELRCTTTLTGAKQIASLKFQACTKAWFTSGGGAADGSIFVSCRDGNDGFTLAARIVSSPIFNYGSGTQFAEPITDHQLGELLKQSPQVVNAVLIDPETGAPIRTQELTDAINDLRRSLEAANGMAPGPDVLPTDDPSKTQPMESQWPGFCSWATTVCDFVDWVRTEPAPDEKPEVPWQEDTPGSITQSWSSGLGGGSCPSPVSFSVSLGGVTSTPEFEFTPICSFGTTMRPVIIALATIIAGFIIAGVRGSKNA